MELQNVGLRLALVMCLGAGYILLVSGQGRLLDPPGRSSMWRVGFDTPVNPNDNSLSCGGIKHRWEVNKGKCGVCGDPWDSKPRQNEAGGKYATNIISRVYTSGSVIKVKVEIAVVNGGYFEFRLCPNNDFSKPASSKCLDAGVLSVVNGSKTFDGIQEGINTVEVQLPEALQCEQCVFQWKYRTADHIGCYVNETTKEVTCEFGHGEIQTEYYGCADIAIFKNTQNGKKTTTGLQDLQAFSVSSNNVSAPAREKRFVDFTDYQSFSVEPISRNVYTQIPYKTRSGPPNWESFRWMDSRPVTRASRTRRRAHGNQGPVRRQLFSSSQSRGFSMNPKNGRTLFTVRQGEFFPGNRPVASLIQVQDPVMRQIFANEEGGTVSLSSPMIQRTGTTRVQNVFMDPYNPTLPAKQVVHTVRQQINTQNTIPVTQCSACPFDKCLDTPFELDGLFPGLFNDPIKFLDCAKYTKLFNLKKYKVVSDGLPDCSHPRFKRQLVPNMPFVDDDDAGCCSTRPQVIMPLTVESDNTTYDVVQLRNDKNQFLVQGLCSQNRTTSCTNCAPEHNFQWILVYDPKTDSNPPVSFVPVKFRHYCRCVNRGRRMFTG